MAIRPFNIIGLCSGLGWLEFSAYEIMRRRGFDAQIVCHCEREAVTSALLARLGDATGHCAPIWDDIATFDGRPWSGIVDCLVAGLPCPAYSVAGARLGNDDERAWGPDGESGPQYHFLRIVSECLPGIIFMENVPGYVSGGHARRLGDGLLGLGYRIAPAVFLSAADVGATQLRERVYVMAYLPGVIERKQNDDDDSKRNERNAWEDSGGGRSQLVNGAVGRRSVNGSASRDGGHADESDEALGECGGAGRERSERAESSVDARQTSRGSAAQPGCDVERANDANGRSDMSGKRPEGRGAVGWAGEDVEHSESSRRSSWSEIDTQHTDRTFSTGDYVERESLSLFPPGNGHWTDPEWQRVLELDATRVPAVEPGFSVVVDGMAVAGSDLLRIGGNGVVLLAASVAFDFLLDNYIFGSHHIPNATKMVEEAS